jgi:hypothetical protein
MTIWLGCGRYGNVPEALRNIPDSSGCTNFEFYTGINGAFSGISLVVALERSPSAGDPFFSPSFSEYFEVFKGSGRFTRLPTSVQVSYGPGRVVQFFEGSCPGFRNAYRLN